jgi:hypothetical protein
VISSISPTQAAPPAIMASSMASSRPFQDSDYKCLISQIGFVPHFSLCAVPTRRGPPNWLRSAFFFARGPNPPRAARLASFRIFPCARSQPAAGRQIGFVRHFSLCAVPTRRGPPNWLRSAFFFARGPNPPRAAQLASFRIFPCARSQPAAGRQIGFVRHFSLCAVPTRRGPPNWLRFARFNRPGRPLAEAGLQGSTSSMQSRRSFTGKSATGLADALAGSAQRVGVRVRAPAMIQTEALQPFVRFAPNHSARSLGSASCSQTRERAARPACFP